MTTPAQLALDAHFAEIVRLQAEVARLTAERDNLAKDVQFLRDTVGLALAEQRRCCLCRWAGQAQVQECASHQATRKLLETERDEARAAARWLLPFLANEPRHLDTAVGRWPWLQDPAA